MDVIAHRGFADDGVENTLSRLTAAVSAADAVEFDIRVAGDGVPVVFHDERVDRLTDHSGPVTSYTADELASMSLADTDDGIPRLTTALDRLTGPIIPEIKVDERLGRTAELLSGYPDRVLVSSFQPAVLDAMPPALAVALLVAPPVHNPAELPAGGFTAVQEAADYVASIGGRAVHPHVSACEREVVAVVQEAGLVVNAWTVRSAEAAAAMRAAGVDGVITDSPAYVRDA